MPTIGGGDDFVWIGGPDEGLWLLVVVGDEAIDGGLEIDDAFEDAALEAPLGEDGEETLDGVEPTGRGGREMNHPFGGSRPRATLWPRTGSRSSRCCPT